MTRPTPPLRRWTGRLAFAAAASLILGLLTATPAHALPTTYYVSFSSGSDANSGTSPSEPWKTLSKVSAQTFSPGDTILLKSGDTWTGETLTLNGNGSSSNWITLSSYGPGDRPKIYPYPSVSAIPEPHPTDVAANGLLYAVFLHNNAGWKIQNLEVGFAKAGIVYRNEAPGTRDGLWIENVFVHDITKWPVNPFPSPDNRVAPLDTASYSMGIFTFRDESSPTHERLTNVTVKNVTIERTDAPIEIRHADNVDVSNLTATDSGRAGVIFVGINYGEITGTPVGSFRDSSIQRTGLVGMSWGTAGLQFNAVKNFVADTIDIGYTFAPNLIDGVGVDFEGLNVNVTVQNSYVHHSDDEAVMVYRNPQWSGGVENVNTSLINNTFVNNGLLTDSTHAAFLVSQYNSTNGGTISGNSITKTSRSQPLNWVAEYSPVLTERWPDSNYTLSNNRIYLPNGNQLHYASTGFAPVQGQNQWSYKEYDGNSLNDLTWDAGLKVWKGAPGFLYVGDDWMHPAVGHFTERVWTADSAGTIRVTGTVRKFDSTAGNGVVASIFKNGTLVWSPPAITDLVGASHDFGLEVQAGDMIAFVINANGDSSHDKTYWNPVVEEITQSNFVARDDFMGQQEMYNWRYLEKSGSGFTLTTWDAANAVWTGSAPNLYVGADWMHPAIGTSSVREWTAPTAGTVTLSGLVKKTDSTAGNGVIATIWKNGTKIWGDTSVTTLTGVSYSFSTTVSAGDVITFEIDADGNADHDKTVWNPVVSYQ